jgi:hypothetical protein
VLHIGEIVSMLEITPNGIWSWDYSISDDEGFITQIDSRTFREACEFALGQDTYTIRRDGLMSGMFRLRSGEDLVASAEKPSAFHRRFIITSADESSYELIAESAFGRRFLVNDDSGPAGYIEPLGIFTRKARAELEPAIPDPIRIFMIWLTLMMWRRATNTASSSS